MEMFHSFRKTKEMATAKIVTRVVARKERIQTPKQKRQAGASHEFVQVVVDIFDI